MKAVGEIEEDSVIVQDEKEGQRLYNRGYFGKPLSGGGLELDLYEALYLRETDRLEIVDSEGIEVERKILLKKGDKTHRRFPVRYQTYHDIRERGYVLKQASRPADFRVFPRGGGPGKTPSKYWLRAERETSDFDSEEIVQAAKRVKEIKKKLLVGIMDEERDVTYYEISTIDLKQVSEKDTKDERYEGVFLEDSCYLIGRGKDLYENGFYGRWGEETLQLSLMEAVYLSKRGVLDVSKEGEAEYLKNEEIYRYAERRQDDFRLKYGVYEDMREMGMIPKTGFKYGTVFRAYKGDPDEHHAEYLVHPVKEGYESSWYDVSRMIRVAHGVKKELILAVQGEDDLFYIKMERETP